ncbi:MAG: FHA domain-containing protein [Pyrinomonadaceae bacterium]
MQKFTLIIKNPRESRSVDLDGELSVGRTTDADLTIDDVGLSRVNTTFFRDGEMIFAVDENSTNGTFINGKRIENTPRRIFDGDVLKIGSETHINVESGESGVASIESEPQNKIESEKVLKNESRKPKTENRKPKPRKFPPVLALAGGLTFVFITVAVIALTVAKQFEDNGGKANAKKTPNISAKAVIPIRVIDPLGGQTPEDLQELAQLWEVQEKEVEATDLADVTASAPTDSKSSDASVTNLKVSVAFWQQQRAKALEARNTPTGNDPPGQQIPREVFGDGVIKQKAKIAEMIREGYQQPMDFAELAQKKMSGELVELPMATDDYVLEVGGSSGGETFTSFNFAAGNVPIAAGTEKFTILQKLAGNFSGEKYDINNPDHRKQIRIRLLRMFHPRAKPVLEKLARAYREKFNRPLRVTSLSRSMDYQIGLNKMNPNSFKVRGAGSLPPHTSGCAFDLARKHMTADEQNFMMAQLAQMEREGILDALREGNLNACFHVFIYDDGQPPKM